MALGKQFSTHNVLDHTMQDICMFDVSEPWVSIFKSILLHTKLPRGRRGMSDTSVLSDMCLIKLSEM